VEECREIVVRIGQLSYIMRRLRSQLEDMMRYLYEDEFLRRFGESAQVWEALQNVEWDLARGRLKLEDLKICNPVTKKCIDTRKFLSLLDDYYEAFGARQKMWRELMRCLEI